MGKKLIIVVHACHPINRWIGVQADLSKRQDPNSKIISEKDRKHGSRDRVPAWHM
jgi:hypothetical protein